MSPLWQPTPSQSGRMMSDDASIELAKLLRQIRRQAFNEGATAARQQIEKQQGVKIIGPFPASEVLPEGTLLTQLGLSSAVTNPLRQHIQGRPATIADIMAMSDEELLELDMFGSGLLKTLNYALAKAGYFRQSDHY